MSGGSIASGLVDAVIAKCEIYGLWGTVRDGVQKSLPDQTLHNWLKALHESRLGGPGAKPVTPEQMELARLRVELTKTDMGLVS